MPKQSVADELILNPRPNLPDCPQELDSLLRAARLALSAGKESPRADIARQRITEVLREIDPSLRPLAEKLSSISATPRDFFYLLAASALFEHPKAAITRMSQALVCEGYLFKGGRKVLADAEALLEAGPRPVRLLKAEVIGAIAENMIGGDLWSLQKPFRVDATERYHGVNERRAKVRTIHGGNE